MAGHLDILLDKLIDTYNANDVGNEKWYLKYIECCCDEIVYGVCLSELEEIVKWFNTNKAKAVYKKLRKDKVLRNKNEEPKYYYKLCSVVLEHLFLQDEGLFLYAENYEEVWLSKMST
jgi:hypothetical protein